MSSSFVLILTVTKSCVTHCNPTNCSTPSFPALLYRPEFAQTHVHWVSKSMNLRTVYLLPWTSVFLIFQTIINIIGTVQYFSRGLSLSGLRVSVQMACPACLSNEGMIQHAGQTVEQRWPMSGIQEHLCLIIADHNMHVNMYGNLYVYIYIYIYGKWCDNKNQFSHVGLGSDKKKMLR